MKKFCLFIVIMASLLENAFGAWNLEDINSKQSTQIDFSKDQTYFSVSKKDILLKNWGEPVVWDTTTIMDNQTSVDENIIDNNNNEKIIGEVTTGSGEYEAPLVFPKIRFSLIEEKIRKASWLIVKEVERELTAVMKATILRYRPIQIYSFYHLNTPGSGWAGNSWWWSNTILTDAIGDYNQQISNKISQRSWNISSDILSNENKTTDNYSTQNRVICLYWYKNVNGKCIKSWSIDTSVNTSIPKVIINNGGDIPNSIPNIPKVNSSNGTELNIDNCKAFAMNSQQWKLCESFKGIKGINSNFLY